MASNNNNNNNTCGRYHGGVYCQQKIGHAGSCDSRPVNRICGEYTGDGGYCQKSPGHGGNHK